MILFMSDKNRANVWGEGLQHNAAFKGGSCLAREPLGRTFRLEW